MTAQLSAVPVRGSTMEYCRFGRGAAPLVILPGLSVQSVLRSADAIAEAYRCMHAAFTVYVFDRRKTVPPDCTVSDLAEDTACAMDALGLRGACVFGASQGGMIGMELALRRPALVKKLALGSTSARVGPKQEAQLKRWIALAEAGDRQGLYDAFGSAVYPPAVYETYRGALQLAAQAVTDAELKRFVLLAKSIFGFDLTKELSKITCPVLAIGAYDDGVLDSDATMEIAQAFDGRQDFQLYMYPTGCGHAAYDVAPDYKERLLRFFTTPTGGKDHANS